MLIQEEPTLIDPHGNIMEVKKGEESTTKEGGEEEYKTLVKASRFLLAQDDKLPVGHHATRVMTRPWM